MSLVVSNGSYVSVRFIPIPDLTEMTIQYHLMLH